MLALRVLSFKNRVMRSKTTFTAKEKAEIKALIKQKLEVSKEEQKKIRNQIRKDHQFWFSDFYPRGIKYNVENFEALLKNGNIKEIG